MATIQLLVGDSQQFICVSMAQALNATTGITVVGQASSLDQVEKLCQHHRPDVLLLSLNLLPTPFAESIAVLNQRYHETRLLILAEKQEDLYLQPLLDSGAAGYVLKGDAIEVVIRAIHAVVGGGIYLSRLVPVRSDPENASTPPEPLRLLTKRECEIFALLIQGQSNPEIATELNLAEQTIRNRVSAIYGKLGVHSRYEAITWAWQHGLVE